MGEFRFTSSHNRRPKRTSTARAKLQESVIGELPDQSMGACEGQAGGVREFGKPQRRGAFGERLDDPDDAVHH